MYNLHGTSKNTNTVCSVVSFSLRVRVFKAQIQRADHRSLLRQRHLHVFVFHAQESLQQFGELHSEKQVDTWIGNTVQTG